MIIGDVYVNKTTYLLTYLLCLFDIVLCSAIIYWLLTFAKNFFLIWQSKQETTRFSLKEDSALWLLIDPQVKWLHERKFVFSTTDRVTIFRPY